MTWEHLVDLLEQQLAILASGRFEEHTRVVDAIDRCLIGLQASGARPSREQADRVAALISITGRVAASAVSRTAQALRLMHQSKVGRLLQDNA